MNPHLSREVFSPVIRNLSDTDRMVIKLTCKGLCALVRDVHREDQRKLHNTLHPRLMELVLKGGFFGEYVTRMTQRRPRAAFKFLSHPSKVVITGLEILERLDFDAVKVRPHKRVAALLSYHDSIRRYAEDDPDAEEYLDFIAFRQPDGQIVHLAHSLARILGTWKDVFPESAFASVEADLIKLEMFYQYERRNRG